MYFKADKHRLGLWLAFSVVNYLSFSDSGTLDLDDTILKGTRQVKYYSPVLKIISSILFTHFSTKGCIVPCY